MNKEEFIVEFQDVLQTEEVLTPATVLEELDEWDSLSKMSTIAFLDKNFGIKITFNDVNNFITIEDILKKAGL